MLYIDNKPVEATEFAFEGCHKFYVVDNDHDRAEMVGYGYDIYPISALQRYWDDSECGLRFIHSTDLDRPALVPQFPDDEPHIEYRA